MVLLRHSSGVSMAASRRVVRDRTAAPRPDEVARRPSDCSAQALDAGVACRSDNLQQVLASYTIFARRLASGLTLCRDREPHLNHRERLGVRGLGLAAATIRGVVMIGSGVAAGPTFDRPALASASRSAAQSPG